MTPVFISLLLAHFAADYPLQPGWMVVAKRRLRGLSLHILIHIVTMFVIFGRAALQAWPVLLSVAAAHFWIDFVKVRVNLARPRWVVAPYVIDQGMHYLTLWFGAIYITRLTGLAPLLVQLPWSAYALGYLLVTYVWFISERIFVHAQAEIVKESIRLRWPRMLGRAALLSVLLFGLHGGGAVAISAGLVGSTTFERRKYRFWALLIDIGISLLVFWLVQLALIS